MSIDEHIPDNWRWGTVGEFCTHYSGGTSFSKFDYTDSGIPVLAKGDIKPYGRFEHGGTRFVSKIEAEVKGFYLTQPGDLLMTTRDLTQSGSVLGLLAPIPSETKYLVNQGVNIVRINDALSLDFLIYWANGPIYRAHMRANAIGSTQIHIRKDAFIEAPILLPPLPEQKAIASVLSSLDDKIDLLHRQNKTLEAMAETLFQQWFVAEADDSWEEGTLGDIVTVVSGTTPKTNNPDFWNGEYYWTSPRDITNLNGIYLFDTERKITRKGLDQIGSGLLPVGSLLMSSRAPVGALAFPEIPVAINQGYAGIVCDKGFSREFVYLWLKMNMDYVQSHANGSTFQEISKSTFKTLNIAIPDKTRYLAFQANIFPMFDKLKKNSRQIQTIEKLRDTLLPKLMSGEVRVKV